MVVSASFKQWLKANTGMKLTQDSAINRIIYEGLTNYESLLDFDKKSIQSLPTVCKAPVAEVVGNAAEGIVAEAAIPGATISTISTRRLIVAMNAAIYYTSIGRALNTNSMHYTNVLTSFKIEWEDYESLKSQDDPTVPVVNDKDNDRKVIKWVPIFLDCVSRTYGSRGPLAYVLRDTAEVPTELEDPLLQHSYYGQSGSLFEELIARLPHTGAIYRNDNATVYMLIEKSVRGTSVESTVKSFSRRKDGRSAFKALVANHAGDIKYRAIMKKRMNHLQNIKWNGRSYALESHVSNHRTAVDDLKDCAGHITVAVPDESQRVEYLIDSISCSDNTLQAAIGLIRANTNNMRENFELAASTLIEVDPYRRSQKSGGNPRQASVSSIDFGAGRGTTGVDLRWYPNDDFRKLPENQKTELREWMKTQEGKKAMRKSRADAQKRKQDSDKSPSKPNSNAGNWKKKMKRAMKTPNGLKSVMSLLADEEKANQGFIAALQSNALPPSPPAESPVPPATSNQPTQARTSAVSVAFPSTSVKLQTILKNSKK
jgi:hypothetical protein